MIIMGFDKEPSKSAVEKLTKQLLKHHVWSDEAAAILKCYLKRWPLKAARALLACNAKAPFMATDTPTEKEILSLVMK